MERIKIKSLSGDVLFEYEKENNTLKDTLIQAVGNGANLEGAYLEGANLYGANLYGAYLKGANLKGANLEGANLEGANLEGAYLKDANLEGANLKGAYLEGANLEGANLKDANLEGANLYGANLEGANLKDANLEGAKFPEEEKTKIYNRSTHLADGDIIGYKNVRGRIIKLLIPSDAKRCHAIGHRKSRAEFAKVLEISDGSSEIVNCNYTPYVTYKVGEIVRPDKYDDDILTECGNGINFFISRIEAEEY